MSAKFATPSLARLDSFPTQVDSLAMLEFLICLLIFTLAIENLSPFDTVSCMLYTGVLVEMDSPSSRADIDVRSTGRATFALMNVFFSQTTNSIVKIIKTQFDGVILQGDKGNLDVLTLSV
jgi:hypothetical protein